MTPGVGVAVDVRDAVGVALDARADGADAGRRAGDGLVGDERRVVLVDQRGRLVVAGAVGAGHELRVGHVAEERREAVVHLRLRVGREQPGARGPGHAGLPLAVGDHVQGGGRRSGRRENAEHDHGERERASQDVSSSGHAGRGRADDGAARYHGAKAVDTLSSRSRAGPCELAHTPTARGKRRPRAHVLARHATKPSSHPGGRRGGGRPDPRGGAGRRCQAHRRGRRRPPTSRPRSTRSAPTSAAPTTRAGRPPRPAAARSTGTACRTQRRPQSVPGRHLPRSRRSSSTRPAPLRVSANAINPTATPCVSTIRSSRSSRPRSSSRRPARTSTTATSSWAPLRLPRPSGFGSSSPTSTSPARRGSILRPEGALLDSAAAPASPNGGLSFAGESFDAGERIGHVRVTSGTTTTLTADPAGQDAVAQDDFVYGEPLPGLVALHLTRRASRRTRRPPR